MANNNNYIELYIYNYIKKPNNIRGVVLACVRMAKRPELTIKTRYSTSTVYHSGAGIIHELMS